MPANITTDAEQNIITAQPMRRAREVDFVQRFEATKEQLMAITDDIERWTVIAQNNELFGF